MVYIKCFILVCIALETFARVPPDLISNHIDSISEDNEDLHIPTEVSTLEPVTSTEYFATASNQTSDHEDEPSDDHDDNTEAPIDDHDETTLDNTEAPIDDPDTTTLDNPDEVEKDVEFLKDGSIITLTNIKTNELLYSSDDEHSHDPNRRNVFAQHQLESPAQGEWELEEDSLYPGYFRIKSHMRGEYLFAAGDCLKYDVDRRKVFTWRTPNPDLTGKALYWKIEKHSDGYILINYHFEDYLYRASNDFSTCDTRRAVFAWNNLEDLGTEGIWIINHAPKRPPPVDFKSGDVITIKNYKSSHTLYVSPATLSMDSYRRNVFAGVYIKDFGQDHWVLETDEEFPGYFRLKSTFEDEYLYAAEDGFNLDDDHRRIFTWRDFDVDYQQKNFYWNIEATSSGGFRIKNLEFDDFIYQESDNYAICDSNKAIFATKNDKKSGPESIWLITKVFTITTLKDGAKVNFWNFKSGEFLYPGGDDSAKSDIRPVYAQVNLTDPEIGTRILENDSTYPEFVRIKSKYTGEYLFAGDDSSKYDSQRRRVFTDRNPNPDLKDQRLYWKIFSNEAGVTLKNLKFGDYLYRAADHFADDSTKRAIFAWSTLYDLGPEGIWFINEV